MRNWVWHVKEERLTMVGIDELHGPLRDPLGQEIRIRLHLDHLLAFEQRERREVESILFRVKGVNVVTVRDAKKLVETLKQALETPETKAMAKKTGMADFIEYWSPEECDAYTDNFRKNVWPKYVDLMVKK